MNFSNLSAFSIGIVCPALFGYGLSGPAAATLESVGDMPGADRLTDPGYSESVFAPVRPSSLANPASSDQAEVLANGGKVDGGLTITDALIETQSDSDWASRDWAGSRMDRSAPDSLTDNRLPLAQPLSSENLVADGSATAVDDLPPSGPLEVYGQAVLLQENADTSGRLRGTVFYPLSDTWLLGAEADLTFGEAFSGDGGLGARLNELYAAYAPEALPELRFVAGLIDFTSYFDRNSFAKDKTTHFFNPVFETNPALSAVGIDSKPGLLVNWSPVDAVELKAAGFSSSRDLGDLALDSVAVEAGLRWGNAIVRGTYSNSRDGGRGDGFEEIFQFDRGDGRFGLRDGDREEAFGVNGELFIPAANLGLFGRYGHYRNLELDEGGDTFSLGLNWFDVGLDDSRLGLGYGRGLSQDGLRRDRGDKRPDVVELFYDFPIAEQARAAVSLQQREEFSETVLGVRVKRLF